MKKLFLALVAFILIFTAKQARANTYGIYEAPPKVEKIIIDKFVGYPVEEKGGYIYKYVDNLGIDNYNFSPQEYIFFRLKVTNTSGADLKNVIVKDSFPNYLEIFEDIGTFDIITKTITIDVGDMKKDEVIEYTLKGRVVQKENLPIGESLTCIVNKGSAKTNSAFDEDTSQFCIKHPEKTVKEIPATGAQGVLITLFSTISGFVGLRLRRYS